MMFNKPIDIIKQFNEYCGRFLPAVRFFLPHNADDFTTLCGTVYHFNLKVKSFSVLE